MRGDASMVGVPFILVWPSWTEKGIQIKQKPYMLKGGIMDKLVNVVVVAVVVVVSSSSKTNGLTEKT